MPRLQDAGGGHTNYFDITSDLARQNQLLEAGKLDPLLANATALQMYREAINRTPMDTAKALFGQGVKGALLQQGAVKQDAYRALELIEYSPTPEPLISSQVVFNATNTADMVANPNTYRAYCRCLAPFNLVLAGIRVLATSSTPPPLPILPYANAAFPDATYSTYTGADRLTNGAPTILYGARVGNAQNVDNSTNGIGFDIFYNATFSAPKRWNITLYYYRPTGGAIQSYPLVINNTPQYNSVTIGGEQVIRTIRRKAGGFSGYENVQIYWNVWGALLPQPTGFNNPPNPAAFTFAGGNLAVSPRIVWDCA